MIHHALTLALVTQTPPTPLQSPTFFDLQLVDGVAHAAGPEWKARFDSGGFSFTPALGPKAPTNRPVRFELETLGRREGLGALTFDGASPMVEHNRVDYAHPGGVVERYEVRAEGIEQSFLVQQRPAGSGDLIVGGRLHTDLERPPELRQDHGLALRAEDDAGVPLGNVRIGGVTGIDRHGLEGAGWLELEGDELRVVLPESFVDVATFPLWIDPVWSADIPLGAVTRNPDVVWSEPGDRFAIVYEFWFSQTDVDLRARTANSSGGLTQATYLVDSGAGLSRRPRVCDLPEAGRFLITYAHAPTLFERPSIRARMLGHSGGIQSLADVASSDERIVAHDALGIGSLDPTLGTTSASILLHDEFGVGSLRELWVDNQLGFGTTPSTADQPFYESGASSSNHTGSDVQLVQVPDHAGLGRRIALVEDPEGLWPLTLWRDGQPGEAFPAPASVIADRAVSGHAILVGDDVLLAYAEEQSGDPAQRDVRLAVFPPAVDLAESLNLVQRMTVSASSSLDERLPRLVHVGEEVVVVHQREVAAAQALTYEAVYSSYRKLGLDAFPWPLAEPEQTTSSADWIASASISGQTSAERALFVAQADMFSFPLTSEVQLGVIEAMGDGGTVVDNGGGCGGGGTLQTVGPAALGNGDFRAELFGLSPTSSVTVLNITFPQNAFACGGCKVAPWLIWQATPVVAGSAEWALPIAHQPNWVGATVLYQACTYFSSSQNCPLLPFWSWSNQLEVTFGL